MTARLEEERGAVAILVAVLLPVLLGGAALAIDVGRWYVRGQEEQKAVDAAALAGAVHLPGDPAAAFAAARDLAGRNGYADDPDTEVTVTQGSKRSQLRVSVSQERDNVFGGLLGIGSTRITRTAVAEYQAPVPMGSPTNTFGNEPLGGRDVVRWSTAFTTAAAQPMFWANVAGPQSPKRNGDAHQAGTCQVPDDRCAAPVNAEHSPNGYFFTLRVPPAPAGTRFVLEAFDPAFVHVGDHCTANLAGATASVNPAAPDAAQRYATGDGPFCTGDMAFGGAAPTTSFLLRAPTATPWDPTSAPVVRTAGCDPRASQFRGHDLPLAEPLRTDAELQRVFRQWVRLCELAAPPPGDYLVQVRTNVRLGADPAGPADPTTPGNGHNRFALRAGFVAADGSVRAAGVRLHATTAMAVYANSTGSTAQFHLVRVPSGSGGRALALSFFDVGDAAAGTIRIVAPPDAGTTFTGCTATGPRSGSRPDCSVATNSVDFQGRWQHLRVPIPAGYACNDGDPLGCWVRIEYRYSGGTQDTTTWSAAIEGDPVRLVE